MLAKVKNIFYKTILNERGIPNEWEVNGTISIYGIECYSLTLTTKGAIFDTPCAFEKKEVEFIKS